ncbi:MAG: transporter permease [Ignavibacteria bacterium]|nr:transporter permease [Ignavibacteria bacterium]
MKLYACFIKTLKENLRDWKIIIMAIVFSPFFVYIMYLYYQNTDSTGYKVLINNKETNGKYSNELVGQIEKVTTPEGKPILNIRKETDSNAAKKMIKNKDADIYVTIPYDFSNSLDKYLETRTGLLSPIISFGDQSNVKYFMAASMVDYTAYNYVAMRAGIQLPLNIKYESSISGKRVSDFDLYVPALLVLSMILILFTTGASIIREVERDTISRLSLSNLKSFEFMTAITLNQIIIGIACLLLTLFSALTVGYKSNGSVWLLLLIAAVTSFSVISIGIITTYFIKNMFGLLTLGCFPFFILMFFSDCFMPLPKINMIQIFGNNLYVNDLLPTATATRALNKILNYNSTFSEISFEFCWIVFLSIIYYITGILLFKKKYHY